MIRAAVRAVAVQFRAERRTNDWYRAHQPDRVAKAEASGLARAFSIEGEATGSFDRAMAAYVADPFRGATTRFVLGPGETCLDLELRAARAALEASGDPSFDLLLCTSWLPERFVAPGNAVFHAAALGTQAPAYNVETACSGASACLQLAHGMVQSGLHRRVLCVASSTNSRQARGSLGWISSDVAAAVVVEGARDGEGLLGACMTNTAATNDVFVNELVVEDDRAVVRMRVGDHGAAALRQGSGAELVRATCLEALSRAGVRLDAIDYFAFSTPLAWSAQMSADALGVDPSRTIDLFARYANVGAPFPFVHLHEAARAGRIPPGALVLVFTVGSTSSAGAVVLRMGPMVTA
jgi:3-oxoacyl-[acyl-carrier-protein] synthase-3